MQHISLKPQPLTLANETMDAERPREIAEEDNVVATLSLNAQ